MNKSNRMYDFHTQLLIDDLIEGLARKIDTRVPDIIDIKNPNLRREKWKAVINAAMCSSAETGYVDGIKESEKLLYLPERKKGRGRKEKIMYKFSINDIIKVEE